MSDRGRDRANQLVVVENSVDFTKRTLPSEHEHERDNCNRHSQTSERSQLSDKGRDWAIQPVVVETSVDFTTHCCHQQTNTYRETAQTRQL